MFCPNCGIKIVKENQRFCHICRYALTTIVKTPQLRTEKSQYPSIARPQSTPVNTGFPDSQQIQIITGEIGPHSKKSLIFGILSIGIALFGYYIGSRIINYIVSYIVYQRMFQNYYFIYQIKDLLVFLLVILIIFIIVHIVGITFGILSRMNSTNARNLEPVNSLEKVGSVIGILGIIGNAIALIVSIIFAVVIFIIF